MAGLYLHIPFCKQACYYCDFHFSTQKDNKEALIDAMCKELVLQKKYLTDELVETIYFGGGTPSLLSESELGSLFDTINQNFIVKDNAEVTLEANPDDLTEQNLSLLKSMGINRLSIGVQSFDDSVLKFLNRVHSAKEAIHCIEEAQKAGINNISIDLIYAIPGQDLNLWKKNIEKAIAISPAHVSAYSLTIEEKTVFGRWQKTGKLHSESDETAATQMEILMQMLGNASYEHYEISNFCKPGFYSRHNSSYWKQKKYLGVGPSAHSYNGHSRQHNINNNTLYIEAIKQETIPFQLEILSRANKINEYLLTTLRTHWGSDLDYLLKEHNHDLLNENHKEIESFLATGLLQQKENFLILTSKGKLLADKIASDLFVES